MKSETPMNPGQYTLSTGKTHISLQAGQTNIHKAAPGETYRVLKRKGENDQEKLADDVVASRHGQDLQLDYADGTTLTLQDWFTQSDTSVTLPADGTSTQLMTPSSTEGAALADGSHVFYAHGSPDALASMTSGHPGLENILSGLQNNSLVTGHQVTYLPQSHSYAGYLAGVLGLGGAIGVGIAAASGGGGHDNGGKQDNGGGEPAVQNAVELNFVGGPALSSNDLNVEIYQADGKTLIGTGTLGPNGSVTVSAGSYSGVVIVKLVNSGGAADYLDEATGVGKDLSAQLWSMGVISGDNSTLVLNINVLTTLAYTKAQEALGGTTDSPATLGAAQVAEMSAAISSLFGVDSIMNTTVVATNGGIYDATDGLSDGEKYGLLLAAFSGAEANAGASTQTILDTVTAGITLGSSSSSLSDQVQSLLIKGAAAATDTSGGLSLIIDTHAPVFTSATTASVNENIGAGQVVWTAVATDPSQFSYSLSTTGDGALFSINAATGAVTLTGNPDFESKANYSFTVVATDAAGNASSQTVTLGINNLDDAAPTITSGTTATAIDENSGAGQVIYTATATDTADISGGFTFSLKAGSDAGLTINPTTGAVTLTGNPDFESKAIYNFTVVATDAAGNASSKAVTLGINNLDEVAPTITSGATATAIDENSGAGQVIYTATATDTADISNGVTFSLKAGSDAGLTIDPITGAVTLTGDPDFESKASYSFTVVATDAAGNASSKAVTLGINNLDEVAPTITSGTIATAINENSGAGQVVYTATATDTADISNGVTFSLKAGSDADLTIDPITGAVTLIGDPDFESKAGYSFTVVATDAAGNASERAVTLGINNLDEVAPTITSGATATAIDENSGAGQVVYTATAVDTGDISAGVTFTLKAGSDAGLTIDATTGAVTLTGDPDFESKASYSFTVVATDAAGNASSKVVTLGINNLDEVAPTITSGAIATAIDENSGAGQVIYTATATDTADISNGVTFSLKLGSDAGLTIDATTGAVTLTGDPDFESKASYSFTVVATDAAGNASDQAVTLGINNLDEVAPTITSGTTATAIDENSGAGQVIYTATATDTGDISNGVTFSLKAGSDAGLTIDATTGAVTLTGDPDFESKAGYSFTVVATDAAGNSSERAVTLGINNLDEVAPTITSGAMATAINENSGAGQVIYTATATDTGDISNGVTFSLKAGSDAGLTIDATTGAVTLTGDPDFESKASYSFTVVATDAAGNASSKVVTLGINNLDEVAPTITSGAIATAIDENSGAGQVIYTATATDTADISNGVTFSLKLGSDAGLTIDATTGAVTLTGDPDFESKASYSFTVVATDAAGNASSKAVTLGINNLDEVAPTITSGAIATAIDENSGAGQVVYTATATDTADISGGITFSLKADSDAGLTIDSQTGAVTLIGDPDFESKASYSFTVIATDAAGNHSDRKVTLGINNLDEVAPTITSGITATAINENSGAAQVIYTATATDTADISNGVTFSLKADSDAGLTINPITGAVTLTGNPDYESKASYSFTVVATDAAGNASSQTVTLDINNVDEVAPSFTTGNISDSYASATVSVVENSDASTAIYTAQAVDNDAADGGEHVTYSLADADNGADAQYFTIDAATGAVTFNASPDYESSHAPQYTFNVVATDAAGHATTQTVTVNVTDVDEIAPTVTLDGSSSGPVMLSPAGGYIYNNSFDTTALGDGSFLVTWAGNTNGNNGIYAQRLNAQGVALGDAVQIATGSANFFLNPSDSIVSVTAINDAGAYAVAWNGKDATSSETSIYTQLFNANGTPISTAVKLDGAASTQDVAPQIATLADGGYIVTWYINGGGVYVQRFDDAGVAVGNSVPLGVSGSSDNGSPQVAVLDNGGYVVTWHGQTAGDYHIYVQQFDANGTGSTPVVLDSTVGISDSVEFQPQITALVNGGYVVTWAELNNYNLNNNNSTYVQQFDATGAKVGSIVVLNGSGNNSSNNGGDFNYPYIAALADGGYAVTWMEYSNSNGSYEYAVYVQQFNAGGSKVGATVQLDALDNNTFNDEDQLPRITALGDGGYVVTWMGTNGPDLDVYAQKFNASGVPVGDIVQLQASAGRLDLFPQVTAVGADGEYMVTWYGYSPASGMSGLHLFVQKFNADGSTYENLVVLNQDGHATVQSNESGTVYLVNDNVVVSQLSDITGAASNQWASTAVTANTSATVSAANLADGTYHAYAVDAAGNLSVISGSSVKVDNTVPVFTSATTAADITDSTSTGDTVYTAAASDANGITYSLNDTTHFRINASTGVVTLLSSPATAIGAQFIVTATDAAGNQTTQTVTYNVVDTTPPGVALIRDIDGVQKGSEMVDVLSSEAGTVYLVNDSVTVTDLNSLTSAADNLVNSVAVTANANAALALAGLTEGTYHAYAVDASGNVSVISGSSVVVDNTVPVFTSAAIAADITDSTAVGDTVYTAAATDANGVSYSLSDNQHFNINASTGVVTLLSSPAKATGAQFVVTATDAAGNQTTQTVTYNVVDTTPPIVTLIRDADGVENGNEIVSVQSTEAGMVYLVSDSVTVTDLNSLLNAADNLVNSVAVTANNGASLALTGLADGTYHAYAVDAAGNVSVISGSSVAVDNTAPVISGGATAIGSTLTSGAAAGTQVYDANASDTHAITYSLDPDSLGLFNINASTGVVTLSSAAVAGSYNFIVTATDAAGNHSSQTVTVEVAVGNNLDGSAVVSGSTSDTSTEMTVNIGLEKLSNGYTVMEYMKQIGGDSITYDPTGALYDGVVRVLDANNNVVKTLDISVPAGYTMWDTQVKALANGGFVVAWSQLEATNWADFSVHYAIYDNNGNLQSSNQLATSGYGVTIAAQSSANGGDFAISYQTMGPGTDQQQAVSVFHYNGSGTSFTEGTQTLIGGNSPSQDFGGVTPPAVQLMKFQLTPGVLTALSDGSYVLSSEVYDWIGTPGQSATSTPIGAFIFKFDENGTPANFDGGSTWQRVNWNNQQNSPTNVIAFNGGFAVFSQEYINATWEVTLYHNDGTLITTNVQSNDVYGMGTQSYHAVDVGAMDTKIHGELMWGFYGSQAASATAYDNGTDLVFVFPDGSGGFSQVTISKTTGELTSDVTDSGITVPQGGQLYNPRIVSDGAGGYDITYSVLFDSDPIEDDRTGYAVGDIYQIGLNAPVAPTVTDAHIAITSTPGGTDGSTYKVGDTVTAVWDNSASGDANTRAVTSVTMDFSQFGASTPATAYDDGTHGDAIAGDGKYTAQYTLTAGAINHVDSRNVAVTVTTANHGTATAADSTGLTVDNTAPVLTSSTPQDNVGSVAAGANLTLTFSEAVLAGSGHITLINDSNGSLSKFIDITDSSQVSISGNTVTINPTTDLAAGANYHVQIDSGALHDTAGNDYAGISTSTGLNFTTAFAGMGDPSTVVFDLTTGQSSDHNGRVFDANTAYTIYIKVNSTNFSLTGLDNNEMWSGAQNLGTDDKIVLVGTGNPVIGTFGGAVRSTIHHPNAIEWASAFSSSGNAALLDANGQFSRGGNNVDLWNGTWAVNPNGDNQQLGQVYLQAMPAGVLTSQGLAFP
ncbi:cadherin domain-containing protein [Enterobacteriaceae bacterium H4N4]|uniref:Cadherin domain-containing protein n=1 Tax=Silvania confinis TaxID=2926470 RepID=A0A9J6QEK2_9ENTR|nr:cadherin domain-containing protein [Silvania confinis]MCU6667798.1 cadherin domain-containing protein [Silvania confinis]